MYCNTCGFYCCNREAIDCPTCGTAYEIDASEIEETREFDKPWIEYLVG